MVFMKFFALFVLLGISFDWDVLFLVAFFASILLFVLGRKILFRIVYGASIFYALKAMYSSMSLPQFVGITIIFLLIGLVVFGTTKKEVSKDLVVMEKLNIKKLPDNVFQVTGIMPDAIEGLIASIALAIQYQYCIQVVRNILSDTESHLLCMKPGNRLDSVVVKVVDEGFTVESKTSIVDIPAVFENIRFGGGHFAVKSWTKKYENEIPRRCGGFSCFYSPYTFKIFWIIPVVEYPLKVGIICTSPPYFRTAAYSGSWSLM